MGFFLALFGNWRLVGIALALVTAAALYGVLWVRYNHSQSALAEATANVSTLQAALDVSRANSVTLRATIAEMNNRAELAARDARARAQQSAAAATLQQKAAQAVAAAKAANSAVPDSAHPCDDARAIIQDFVKGIGQ